MVKTHTDNQYETNPYKFVQNDQNNSKFKKNQYGESNENGWKWLKGFKIAQKDLVGWE